MKLNFLSNRALLSAVGLWLILVGLTVQAPLDEIEVTVTPTVDEPAAPLCKCRAQSQHPSHRSECRPTLRTNNWRPHTDFFGSRGSHNFSCLPEHRVPHTPTNYRVCYKVFQYNDCPEDGYTNCFLSPRTPELECDSENLTLLGTGVRMTSPRYQCLTRRQLPHRYRGQDLCIYNVSLDCEHGIIIEEEDDGVHALEDDRDGSCQDYLELIFDNEYYTFCGNTFQNINRLYNATQFIALFWTNKGNNLRGFSLRVTCAPPPHAP